MKYYGQPFLHVIDYKLGKEVFCFDETGILETEDEKLIAWMKKNKPHIRTAPMEEEPIPEVKEVNLKKSKLNKPKKPKKPTK